MTGTDGNLRLESDAAEDDELVFDYELDASPEKVRRAMTVPELRERWLPHPDVVEVAPESNSACDEVRFRLREPEPPYVESVVSIDIKPNGSGGTWIRIVHRPVAAATSFAPRMAANSNRKMLRAA